MDVYYTYFLQQKTSHQLNVTNVTNVGNVRTHSSHSPHLSHCQTNWLIKTIMLRFFLNNQKLILFRLHAFLQQVDISRAVLQEP